MVYHAKFLGCSSHGKERVGKWRIGSTQPKVLWGLQTNQVIPGRWHTLNATTWPFQTLHLWLVSQGDNMISQRGYGNAVVITMHCTYIFNIGTLWFHGHATWKDSQKPSCGHQTLKTHPHIFHFDILKTVVTEFYGFSYFPCFLVKWFFAEWLFTTLHVLSLPHLRKESWYLPPSSPDLSELYCK